VCGVFGALALLKAAIGLYGVISYSITQRTNEIGIRMALGAQRSGVVRLIMSEAAILVGMGLVVGLGLTFAGGVALEYNFYGVTQRDPLSLALTLVILAAVGFAASFLSARRVSRLDPVVALRYE
jgi:ABC-type antimicrobial peptide transport system permease subunit